MLHQKPARPGRPSLGVALCLALAGCGAPDPKSEVEMLNLETYWAIDSPSGNTQYLAPVVRFDLRNQGRKSRSVQAMATLRLFLPWLRRSKRTTGARYCVLPLGESMAQ